MINIDADLTNADWIKSRWGARFYPYKSAEFMEYLAATDRKIEQFRTTTRYLSAVAQGLIVDDEWVGILVDDVWVAPK